MSKTASGSSVASPEPPPVLCNRSNDQYSSFLVDFPVGFAEEMVREKDGEMLGFSNLAKDLWNGEPLH